MAKKSNKKAATVASEEQIMDQTTQVTEQVTETAPATPAAAPNVLVLLGERKNKAGNVTGFNYGVPGRIGTVRISKKLFAAAAPEAIAVNEGVLVAPDNDRLAKRAAKGERKTQVRLSAEERAAKLQARIDKQNAAAAKNAERLAKINAKLKGKTAEGAEATGSADVAAEGQPQVSA